MVKYFIFIIHILLVALVLSACFAEYDAYKSKKDNEHVVLEYVSANYGEDIKIISSWTGKTDFIAGRQVDAYIMKASTQDGFPFRIEVFNEEITDYYPCSFMGNEISKKLSYYLKGEYSEEIDYVKCNSYVNTNEKTLLTNMNEINMLQNREIEISLYIVSSEMNVHQDILYTAYKYLQETFDDFKLKLYFLNDEDFQIVDEYLNENIKILSSFESLNVHPFSSFEYYKDRCSKDLERSEIISKLKIFKK